MRRLGVAALLTAAVLVVFWPVLGHDFVNFDDNRYVTHNPWVQRGLDAASFRWAWTTTSVANWHPLTWLSHMLDWKLFGPAPRGHHATSLVLHTANTVLCFLVFERMTGALWRSALVAALFGLHPLHVESVAWVSERKDVLSACFWLLGMAAYAAYVRRPGAARLALVALALAAGLASKPMLVTFPAALLLLDWWPLRRLHAGSTPRIVAEKLPLVALVVASCVVTIAVQGQGGAIGTLTRYPLSVRAENALVSWVAYLWKTVWPAGLSVFYPHPEAALPMAEVVGAALVLVGITALAVAWRDRRPHVVVGWLWYLGTLVPVIGLVQVGAHAMADRFTYVPLIGIFVLVAWSLPSGRGTQAVVLAAVMALALRTHAQVAVWKDSVTLFQHALAVDSENALAHMNLGVALTERGELDRAVAHLEESLRIKPGQAEGENALGNAWLERGDPDRAAEHYAAALRLVPDYAVALNNLGFALAQKGRYAEAIPYYERALRIDDRHALAENNLGVALARTGDMTAARAHFERAIGFDPRQADAHSNLGALLVAAGRPAEGLVHIDEAIALRPDLGGAYGNRALALIALGQFEPAWDALRRMREHGTEPPAAILDALRARAPEPAAR
jgi:Flp pilus assembly protein TadD